MADYQFKVGDKAKVKRDCSGCVVGEVYTVTTWSGNLILENSKGETFCTCQDDWELVEKNKEKPVFNIGTKVRISKDSKYFSEQGHRGVGKIIADRGEAFTLRYTVNFGVGYINSYDKGDLEIVTESESEVKKDMQYFVWDSENEEGFKLDSLSDAREHAQELIDDIEVDVDNVEVYELGRRLTLKKSSISLE